ncbi:MAG TPA: sugar ABC transporter ATP-binding protein [Firmicutes bacterium]|nr:sugar ABC transporter ATP-binding protein [Bacillota bacterium]
MSEFLLEMRNVNKRFPGVIALQDVNFALKKGEVHVLLGENGAGKSTLMKILSGAYPMDSGEIFIKGKRVEINKPQDAQELGISIIHQEFNLIPHLSIAQNIFLGREPVEGRFIKTIAWDKMYRKAAEILGRFDINVSPRTPVRELGVAMQQMVEIAKALSVNAEIVVMDEPTAALTTAETEKLFQVIRTLKAQGVSIIYISHRLEELSKIGDVATVLRDGRNVGTVDLKKTDTDTLVRMMVGRSLTDMFPKESVPRGKEALRVENLYGKGVNGVSFVAYEGEVLGFAGIVGCGRTELARAIFGADPASGGRVYVDGREVSISSPRQAIKAGIAYLTEDRGREGLVLGLSVRENIGLPVLDKVCRAGIVNFGRKSALAANFVKNLGIKTPSLSTLARSLSGGNQQKVVLAKWLATKAKVLIFDEPTRGIDVGAKWEIYQLINELAKQGTSVIMISSDLREILGMSDRILVMREGCITGEFDRSEATQEKILYCAAGGKTGVH